MTPPLAIWGVFAHLPVPHFERLVTPAEKRRKREARRLRYQADGIGRRGSAEERSRLAAELRRQADALERG